MLRRPAAPWGLATTDPAVERLSLMKAGNATDVVILSHEPVDLLVLAVPCHFGRSGHRNRARAGPAQPRIGAGSDVTDDIEMC